MTNTKRTEKAARQLAKTITALRTDDPELAAWLAEDISRSIQRFREVQAGLATPVA